MNRMFWSIAQMLSKQILSLIIFGILGWLLDPQDFGMLTTALILITFLDAFVEGGFGSALIQHQRVSNRHFSSIFTLNVIIGAVLTGGGWLISRPVATYLETPLLAQIIQVLSLGFFINALSLTQITLAQKQLLFRRLTIRDTISTIIGGGIGITCALLGYGVWSLVAQTMSSYIINTIILWSVTTWKPNLRETSWSAIKELWPYSSRLFMFNIIKFFSQNIEKFFITSLLGTISLGVYSFANKFTTLPITTFVGSIGLYLFPKYSRLQDNLPSIKDSYLITQRIIQTITTPLTFGVIVSSPFIVPALWHNKWLQAIAIIQILSILAYLQGLISLLGPLLKALNRPQWLVYWSVGITLCVSVSLPLVTIYFKLLGIAWTLVIIYSIGWCVNNGLIRLLLNVTWRELARVILPSLGAALLGVLAFQLIVNILPPFVWLQISCGLGVFAFIYLLVLYSFDRSTLTILNIEAKRLWRAGVRS